MKNQFTPVFADPTPLLMPYEKFMEKMRKGQECDNVITKVFDEFTELRDKPIARLTFSLNPSKPHFAEDMFGKFLEEYASEHGMTQEEVREIMFGELTKDAKTIVDAARLNAAVIMASQLERESRIMEQFLKKD